MVAEPTARAAAQVAPRLLVRRAGGFSRSGRGLGCGRVREGEASRMTPGPEPEWLEGGGPLTERAAGRSCSMKYLSCPSALLMTWLLSVVAVETLGGYWEVCSGSLRWNVVMDVQLCEYAKSH